MICLYKLERSKVFIFGSFISTRIAVNGTIFGVVVKRTTKDQKVKNTNYLEFLGTIVVPKLTALTMIMIEGACIA